MKKRVFTLCLFLCFAAFLWAESPVISISDFVVESDNPSYKYLGKGLATLVAGELRKASQVSLIEREQLNRILEEQEMSLSELVDQQSQVKIGKLVSAQYLLLGKVIDVAGTLIVSARLTNVTSGEIVWQDDISEKVEVYDYIGAYFANSVLGYFGVAAAPATVQKVKQKEDKKPEAIIALSRGVDAYDRNDVQTAQKTLEEAKKLDPASEAASYYLSKLTINTTKFQITTEPYFTYQNPAYLGIIRTDKLYLGGSMPVYMGPVTFETDTPIPYFNSVLLPGGSGYLSEYYANFKLICYAFPLAERMGISVEAMLFSFTDRVWPTSGTQPRGWTGGTSLDGMGGIISAGYRLLDNLSAGLGAAVYGQSRHSRWGPLVIEPEEVSVAVNGGILYFNTDKTFFADARIGWCNGTQSLLDIETFSESSVVVGMPLYNENTLTWAFNGKRTFLIVKQTNDVAFDRVYYFGRVLPAVEHFLTDWFSLRAGIEGSFAFLNSVPNFGYGGMAGITFRIIPWRLDIDVNVSYRLRPSRVVEGLLYPDFGMLVTMSLNKLFISR